MCPYKGIYVFAWSFLPSYVLEDDEGDNMGAIDKMLVM